MPKKKKIEIDTEILHKMSKDENMMPLMRELMEILNSQEQDFPEIENRTLPRKLKKYYVLLGKINDTERALMVLSERYKQRHNIIEDALLFLPCDPTKTQKFRDEFFGYCREISNQADIRMTRADELLKSSVQKRFRDVKTYVITPSGVYALKTDDDTDGYYDMVREIVIDIKKYQNDD